VAAGSGIDLDDRTSCGFDPLGIAGRFLVALDDCERKLTPQIADRALEQRRLAGARRAHQVQGDDAAAGKPSSVAFGEAVVPGEDLSFEANCAALCLSAGNGVVVAVVVVMVMMMLVIMMMVQIVSILMGIGRRVHVAVMSMTVVLVIIG
jgi:hypothetical protein